MPVPVNQTDAFINAAVSFEENFPEAFKEVESMIKAGNTGINLISFIRAKAPMLDLKAAMYMRSALVHLILGDK